MKQILRKRCIAITSTLVACYLKRSNPYVIGVTGSMGKSGCRMIIAQTLEQCFPDLRIVTSSKNYNGELGFLLAVLEIHTFSPSVLSFVKLLVKAVGAAVGYKRGYDILVAEYGIDFRGEMQQLVDVVRPDVAIVTAVDYVHGMQLGSREEIAEQKGLLVEYAKEVVYLNADDDLVTAMQERTGVDVLWFGTKKEADHRVRERRFVHDDGQVAALLTCQVGAVKHMITANLYTPPEQSYVSVALSVCGIVGQRLGLPYELPARMEYGLLPGRCQLLAGIHGSMILDSSYNAAPGSMQMILNAGMTLRQSLFADYELVLVIGEMRELGETSDDKHRLLAEWIMACEPARVYMVGKEVTLTREVLSQQGWADDRVSLHQSSREVGELVAARLADNEKISFIVCKGSQNTIFLEEAIACFLADPADTSKLVRQAAWWEKKKEAWFVTM